MNEMNMDCEEADKLILLHGELDEIEQSGLERHIAGCPSCREKMALQQAWVGQVAAAAKWPIAPLDQGRLTNKIMAGIDSSERKAAKVSFGFGFLDLLKFSMTAVSLILVVTFYVEYTGTSRQELPGNSQKLTATLEPRGIDVLRDRQQNNRSLSLYALLKN